MADPDVQKFLSVFPEGRIHRVIDLTKERVTFRSKQEPAKAPAIKPVPSAQQSLGRARITFRPKGAV